MEEEPGLSDQYRMASPWPMFVAFGLAISEVGVFIGIFPVAVGGLLLFGGSVSGILAEAGYVDNLWTVLQVLGVVLVIAGAVVISTQVDLASVSLSSLLDTTTGITARGLAIVVAGGLQVVFGVVFGLLARTNR
jgi:hypothetical protein